MLILSAVEFDEMQIKKIKPDAEFVHFSGRQEGISPKIAKKAEVLFSFNLIKDTRALDLFTSLKWLQLMSAGYDGLDISAFEKRGITVTNASGVYGIPIAEDVMSKLLMFTRKQHIFLRNMQKNIWNKQKDFIELAGKKMLILGTGDIGREVAKRARAFGVHITGYNSSGTQDPLFDDIVYERKMLVEILDGFDFIVVTLPLSDKTYHFVDEDFLDRLKKCSIIINVSRGRVVDETALIKALKDKKIAAAGLDVVEKEPLLPESELWDMENVIISPHVSGIGDGYMKRLKEVFLNNLEKYPDIDQMKFIISSEES